MTDQKKLTYADIRQSLLDSYDTQNKKSLQEVDGEQTIWGLKALDNFFGYPDSKVSVLSINDARMARFIKRRRAKGLSDGTILLETSSVGLRI
jgi:hypothetical protein